MKILIDENLPKRLRRELIGHEAYTVPQMGWATKKNGELLRLMADEFDAFLTMDSNLKFQQHLASFPIRFVQLVAVSNAFVVLQPLIPRVLEILETVQPGELVVVGELPNQEEE